MSIRYLDSVELQHVTTGKTLNLTKQQVSVEKNRCQILKEGVVLKRRGYRVLKRRGFRV